MATPRSDSYHRLRTTIAERVKRIVGKVLTGNSATSLIGGNVLQQLCSQCLDAIHRHSARW